MDKDELLPQIPSSPSFRIRIYTFGGVRDLLGALVPLYGQNPVSFRIFVRLHPVLSRTH